MKKKIKTKKKRKTKPIFIHGICQCESCIKIRKKNEKNLIYMDPPYHGVKNLYGTKAWKEIDFVRLRNRFHLDCCAGYKVILSMSDTPFIRELFMGYNIKEIKVLQDMSHKKVRELIITNFRDDQLKKAMKAKIR